MFLYPLLFQQGEILVSLRSDNYRNECFVLCLTFYLKSMKCLLQPPAIQHQISRFLVVMK